ncbi:MAG TPA: ADP-ribosylglycohydrolase family protein [Chloroflexota bacterium]|nr:ADP-ribosylglycohydrolase family protein [Chloroflexota bacterium]
MTGDDAGTTGAVYGQLAGCHYGFSAIPDKWSSKIALRSEILDLAMRRLVNAG